jgi:hypothetical protein
MVDDDRLTGLDQNYLAFFGALHNVTIRRLASVAGRGKRWRGRWHEV